MTGYLIKLTTLSPLHIGDGGELRQAFDFMVSGGRTYRLDEVTVLEAMSAKLQADRSGRYPLPGTLLAEADFQNPAFFRYVLPGFPRSRKEDARLQTCIKDVYDRTYIPGSSLKGALRTALAWTAWPELHLQFDRSLVGRNRSWAGQPLERKIFGPNPNEDLLRALQVSDLAGPQQPGEGLIVINAQVLTHKSAESPVEMEAVRSEVTFTGSIHIDDTLFSAQAENRLHFNSRRHWLDELAIRVQKHSLARAASLAQWFGQTDYLALAKFYRQLADLNLPSNQAVLQLGWGTGWDGTTLWTHLQQDKELFEQLVRDYRMTKPGQGAPRQPGDPFPRSKRAVMMVKDGIARAAAPLGWVLLTFEGMDDSVRAVQAAPRSTPSAHPPAPPKPTPTLVPLAASKPAPNKPAAPKAAIIRRFTSQPRPGDRFEGSVVESETSGKVTLELPGIDPDETGMALILPENNPQRQRFADKRAVMCTVERIDPEKDGYYWVICRLG